MGCDDTATSGIFTCNTENHEDSFGCWFFTAREPGVSGERRDMVAVATGGTGELHDWLENGYNACGSSFAVQA